MSACQYCGQETHKKHSRSTCHQCSMARSTIQERATAVVQLAKTSGLLKPATSFACVDCGKQAAHYDHRDYAKPLAVDAVCVRCNFRRGKAAHSHPNDLALIEAIAKETRAAIYAA